MAKKPYEKPAVVEPEMKQIRLFEAMERQREKDRQAREFAISEAGRALKVALGLVRPAPEAQGPKDVLAGIDEGEERRDLDK